MDTNISKLKATLESIGQCEFTYDEIIKDYKFNGAEIIKIKKDCYIKLRESFNEKIVLQIVHKKVNEKLLADLISKTQEYFYHVKNKKEYLRINYLLDRSKNRLRESADWTHKIITAIMNSQLKTLNNLNSFLIKLYEEYEYFINNDLSNFKLEYNLDTDSEKIEFPDFGKINVNLTKKDTISLFLMLENIGILDFKDTDRNKIIEQNFTYNHTNGKVFPMKDINSDISNLKDIKNHAARNKSSFKRLKEKLMNLIERFDYIDFAAKFK